jgi:membrane associated rhomboid family serine protease
MPVTIAKASAASPSATRDGLRPRLVLVGILLAVMWGLEIVDTLLGQPTNSFGIRPRETEGLLGIVFAPVLHGGFQHLVANTLPFVVLAFLTLLRGLKTFVMTTLFVTIVGGLCVWLVGGSNTSHIGASGLIFGYFGYIMALAIFERSFKSIMLAILVGLIYGGMIFGVFPGTPGVSWEGHMFGFLSGAAWAWLENERSKKSPSKAGSLSG